MEKKENYLSKFKRENNLDELGFKGVEEVGEKVVLVLKKEDLTYDEAYASLQYAYNKIKYESNYLKLPEIQS